MTDSSDALKHIFYDWFGYNQLISQKIHNSMTNAKIIKFLHFISDYFANYQLFPRHLVLIILIMAVVVHFQKDPKNEFKSLTLKSIIYEQHIIIFILSSVIGYLIAHLIKEVFNYARPYCDPSFKINELVKSLSFYNPKNCIFSFPSGHSTYIGLIVFSFWTILHKHLKWLGVLLIVLTGFSRIALGMHYLADVTYALILAGVMCILAHKLVLGTPLSPIRSYVITHLAGVFSAAKKKKEKSRKKGKRHSH